MVQSKKNIVTPKTLALDDLWNQFKDNYKDDLNHRFSYDFKCGRAGYILEKKVDNEWVETFSYREFRQIIECVNKKAGDFLIEGYVVDLLCQVGYLEVRRVERNPNAPSRLNKGKSFALREKLRKENKLEKENWKIFHTEEDYIRVVWSKRWAHSNELAYKFVTMRGSSGKGFKNKLSETVRDNPQYLMYYPFVEHSGKK